MIWNINISLSKDQSQFTSNFLQGIHSKCQYLGTVLPCWFIKKVFVDRFGYNIHRMSVCTRVFWDRPGGLARMYVRTVMNWEHGWLRSISQSRIQTSSINSVFPSWMCLSTRIIGHNKLLLFKFLPLLNWCYWSSLCTLGFFKVLPEKERKREVMSLKQPCNMSVWMENTVRHWGLSLFRHWLGTS